MDEIDRNILSALELNARISTSDLARKLGIARTTVQSRIDRMEQSGVIRGYTIKLGQAQQPKLRATVLISFEPHSAPSLLSRIKAIPEVRSAVTTSGRFDMRIELLAQSTDELDNILDTICAAKGVKGSESLIHLSRKIDRD